MLTRDTVDLLGAGREARGYALRCRMILKRGCILPRDVEIFKELGRDFFNYPRGIRDFHTEMLGTFMGSCLAATTEDRWLSTDKGPYEEHGKLLREKGVKNLSDLGIILQNASDPKFIDYVPGLLDYFKGYHTWAHSEIALQDGKEIPNYHFPPTQLEASLSAGD